ncbi:MAG: hypothetical protein QM817_32990 [Archangium sp.]
MPRPVAVLLFGALAGLGLGGVAQLLYSYPPNVSAAALAELLPEIALGAGIGAGAWAPLALAFSFLFERAMKSGSVVRFTAETAGLFLLGVVVLWCAGRFGMGFSKDFALRHALAYVVPGALGAWLGGSLSLRSGEVRG